MRFTISGGFLRALRAMMSLGVMLLSADKAESKAGFAAAKSLSASFLTLAISYVLRSCQNSAFTLVTHYACSGDATSNNAIWYSHFGTTNITVLIVIITIQSQISVVGGTSFI